MKKIFLVCFILGALLGTVVAVAEVTHKETLPSKMVRVAIVRDAGELNLAVEGPYTFIDRKSTRLNSSH